MFRSMKTTFGLVSGLTLMLAACLEDPAPVGEIDAGPSTASLCDGTSPPKRLKIFVREFSHEGVDVACDGDLQVMDGATELTMVGCSDLDASSRTYGTSTYQYTLPDSAPRRIHIQSRTGRHLCPVEYTVQVAAGDGSCVSPAQVFLSTQACD